MQALEGPIVTGTPTSQNEPDIDRSSGWPMKRQKRTEGARDGSETAWQPYETLEAREIRILLLDRGNLGDPLSASFESMALVDQAERLPWERYEALSYAWGERVLSHELLLDGGVIRITVSLYQALKRLRFRDRRRPLWADAVCINQQDMDERSAQVAMMSEIYSLAERVLVWLGEEDFDTRFAISTMRCLTSERVRLGPSLEYYDVARCIARYYELTAPSSWINLVLPWTSKAAKALKSFQTLISRPWFRRLWVVQEVALAASVRVFVGGHEVDWDVLNEVTHMAEYFLRNMSDFDPINAYIQSLRQPWLEQRMELNRIAIPLRLLDVYRKSRRLIHDDNALLELLIRLSDTICSDARDRLYAILALLPPRERECFQVSYDSSSAADVSTKIAEHILTTYRPSGPLDESVRHHAALLFALAPLTQPATDTAKMPSWAPSLQNLNPGITQISSYYNSRAQQSDEGFKVALSGRRPAELEVRGVLGPLILSTGDGTVTPEQYTSVDDGTCDQSRFLASLSWYIECRKFVALAYGIHFDLRESSTRVTWRALKDLNSRTKGVMCSVLRANRDIPRWSVCHNYVHGDHCDGSYMAEVELISAYEPLKECCNTKERQWMTETHNFQRKLCSTARREFYWVPSAAKPGDAICSFGGVRSHFVLRAVGSGGYRIVGDAYHAVGRSNDRPLADIDGMYTTFRLQ